MIKIVLPNAWDFDGPIGQLVDCHSRGIDRDWMVKRAAAGVFKDFEGIKPDKDHSLIHLIALGDAETYGGNRNGDWFYKTARDLDLPYPNWDKVLTKNGYDTKGPTTFTNKTTVGNLERAETFTKFAHVFKHHKNKPHEGHKIYGSIKAAAHNPAMDRVELLIQVPHGKDWDDDLQKMASGEDIPWSMACFTGGTLIRTSMGYKAIENIDVGDLVLTHKGRYCPVTNTSERLTDSVHRLSLVGWGSECIKATSEHPFFAATFNDMAKLSHKNTSHSKVFRKSHRHELHNYLKWVPARELTNNHYIGVPIPQTSNVEIIDKNYAKLMGYFIGDGSVSGTKDNLNVQFSCHKNDIIRGEIASLANWASISEYPHQYSAVGLTIGCFSKSIADTLVGDVGRAANKQVPLKLFNTSREAKLAFLIGWFNSDGWQDKKGIHWSTSDYKRALDLQLLLATLDMPATCVKIRHTSKLPRNRKRLGSGIEYVVNISNEFSSELSTLTPKITHTVLKSGRKPYVFISGKYLMVHVKSNSVETLDTLVYNFSVDVDDTYTANLLAVHNCKVPFDICNCCGHKAKTRDDYCCHLQNDLTSMLKTGHVVGAVNDHMTFFDISRVIRPADRIAWSLVKEASNLVKSAADLAFDPEYAAFPTLSTISNVMGPRLSKRAELLHKAAKMEKHINMVPAKGTLRGVRPKDENGLTEKVASLRGDTLYRLPDAFKALADAQVCLPFEKWAVLALGLEKSAELVETISEARKYLNGAFNRAVDNMDVIGNSAYDPATSYPSAGMRKIANDLSQNYGMNPEQVKSRAIYNTIRLDNNVTVYANSNNVKVANDIEGLVQNYISYKLAFLESVQNSDPHSINHFIETCVAQNIIY